MQSLPLGQLVLLIIFDACLAYVIFLYAVKQVVIVVLKLAQLHEIKTSFLSILRVEVDYDVSQ